MYKKRQRPPKFKFDPIRSLKIVKAVQRQPEREEPHIGRSECWLRLGKPEEALASADAAIKCYKVCRVGVFWGLTMTIDLGTGNTVALIGVTVWAAPKSKGLTKGYCHSLTNVM